MKNRNFNLILFFFQYCWSTHERSFSHAVAYVYSVNLLIYCAKCCRPTTSAKVLKNNNNNKNCNLIQQHPQNMNCSKGHDFDLGRFCQIIVIFDFEFKIVTALNEFGWVMQEASGQRYSIESDCLPLCSVIYYYCSQS